MPKTMKHLFPIIRNREEVLDDIHCNPNLQSIYDTWTYEQQKLFLDYCSGVRGFRLLSDPFFKEIINPEIHPERLETILSLLLKTNLKILRILPNDSSRIAAERTLLILDIVVQLENGSIANVEVQRIGYAFPGQRSACYSADLLLRQYKRLRSEKGKKFSYRDIKKVYTIVFFEKSTQEFHLFPDTYIHYMRQKSDTGVHIDLLQEYVFIALDIFNNKAHNDSVKIDNTLEAWLTFLSEDNPEYIFRLLETHPEFKPLYQEVYEICLNTENIMKLFSKELEELDKNTVQYMIDEMQNTINAQKEQLVQKDNELVQKDNELLEKDAYINVLLQQLKQLTPVQ